MAPNNPLPVHGNEKTMNLNTLILTNIQSSPYFKVNLFELKTYHQVIDEIYYKVEHLEPWEKGSRKTAGQTGMCGGVRGVGAGGIVSSAYCLLYKLFTLKLTKKQVIGLITHQDSPYIRGLGFMYIRYTQNPADLWDWYEDYLEDEEELDVKAGGGHVMPIGEMVKQWLCKLEWYSTLFPRIPVPIQKSIESKMRAHNLSMGITETPIPVAVPAPPPSDSRSKGRDGRKQEGEFGFGEAERFSKLRDSPQRADSIDRKRDSRPSPPFDINKAMEHDRSAADGRDRRRSRSREHERRRSRSRDRGHKRSRSADRHGHRQQRQRSRSPHDRHRHRRSRSRDRKESSHRGHKQSERGHKHSSDRGHRESSFDRDLRRERDRVRNGR